MVGARYPTKKALKENVGKHLRFVETSMFGQEVQGRCLLWSGPTPIIAGGMRKLP